MPVNGTRGDVEPSGRTLTSKSHATLWPQANLAHPVLRVSPTFGEAMRGHAELGATPTTAYAAYLKDGRLCAAVEWGDWTSESGWVASLTVTGLGRRPANVVLAATELELEGSDDKPVMELTWVPVAAADAASHPEYLLQLEIVDTKGGAVLRRCLHVKNLLIWAYMVDFDHFSRISQALSPPRARAHTHIAPPHAVCHALLTSLCMFVGC